MPTYDYVCDACDHKFELFQSITAEPEKKCPECGKKKLRRLFGAGAAIVFKGSGFYQTDYRSDSYKKRAEADSKSSESKPAEGKSETKSSESKSSESKSSGGSAAKSEKKSKSKGD
ncbi:MAG TPA: zinc ribbon domain-containing protein [Pirellulales bacterium]|nr:zinc ribbon domain-containing protein [Pirellulales bacterium]